MSPALLALAIFAAAIGFGAWFGVAGRGLPLMKRAGLALAAIVLAIVVGSAILALEGASPL